MLIKNQTTRTTFIYLYSYVNECLKWIDVAAEAAMELNERFKQSPAPIYFVHYPYVYCTYLSINNDGREKKVFAVNSYESI